MMLKFHRLRQQNAFYQSLISEYPASIKKGYGGLYTKNADKLEQIYHFKGKKTNYKLTLLPGRYKVIFRSLGAKGHIYTREKEFTIKSGKSKPHKNLLNMEMKDTRSGFGAGLTELGRINPKVVALCADLTGSLNMNDFKNENPNRFFQVGIAEANMIGIAAGMTIGGKIPLLELFANFSTSRVYDQIRQSIAYSGKNVKICASRCRFNSRRRWCNASSFRRYRYDENVYHIWLL